MWVMSLSTLLILLSTIMLTIAAAESKMSIRVDSSSQAYSAAESGMVWAKKYAKGFPYTSIVDSNPSPGPGPSTGKYIDLSKLGPNPVVFEKMYINDPALPTKELSSYQVTFSKEDGIALDANNFDTEGCPNLTPTVTCSSPNNWYNTNYGQLTHVLISSTGQSGDVYRKLSYRFDASVPPNNVGACSIIDIEDKVVVAPDSSETKKFVTEFNVWRDPLASGGDLEIGFSSLRDNSDFTATNGNRGVKMVFTSAAPPGVKLQYRDSSGTVLSSAKADLPRLTPASGTLYWYRVIMTYIEGQGLELKIYDKDTNCVQAISMLTVGPDANQFKMASSYIFTNSPSDIVLRDTGAGVNIDENILKVGPNYDYRISTMVTTGFTLRALPRPFDINRTGNCGGLRIAGYWNGTATKYLAVTSAGEVYSGDSGSWVSWNVSKIPNVEDIVAVSAQLDVGGDLRIAATRPNGETYIMKTSSVPPTSGPAWVLKTMSTSSDPDIVAVSLANKGKQIVAVRKNGELYFAPISGLVVVGWQLLTTGATPPDVVGIGTTITYIADPLGTTPQLGVLVATKSSVIKLLNSTITGINTDSPIISLASYGNLGPVPAVNLSSPGFGGYVAFAAVYDTVSAAWKFVGIEANGHSSSSTSTGDTVPVGAAGLTARYVAIAGAGGDSSGTWVGGFAATKEFGISSMTTNTDFTTWSSFISNPIP